MSKHGITLKVWGDYACFTRPEFNTERVSYDALTPSAACGILGAIHWKPAISWVIDRIHVLNPIRFSTIFRNEIDTTISGASVRSVMTSGDTDRIFDLVTDPDDRRTQRSSRILRDVAYVIEAHFEMTRKAGEGDNPSKHADIFRRRAEIGQCFHRPSLGIREYAADFELLDAPPAPNGVHSGVKDLGWMLHSIDYLNNSRPRFFRPQMVDGVFDVPGLQSGEVLQ